MSIINKIIIFFFSIYFFSVTCVTAEELKKIGKFKDGETLVSPSFWLHGRQDGYPFLH